MLPQRASIASRWRSALGEPGIVIATRAAKAVAMAAIALGLWTILFQLARIIIGGLS